MPRAPKRRCYMLEEGLPSQSEAQSLLGAQIPEVEEEATSFPSCSCSSFPSSPSFFSSSSSSSCSCSSSPSSSSSCSSSASSCSFSSYSCCCCLVLGYIKALSAINGTARPLQVPQTACFLPNAMTVPPSTKLYQGSSSQEEERPGTSQALPDAGTLLGSAIDDEATNLVQFLLLKYLAKELTTEAEMLSGIIKEYQDYFPEIFAQASECLQLLFGIDMKEMDSSDHSYVLVNTLGLTFNGTLNDGYSIPKAGLLINILGVIFMHGDSIPEKDLWDALSVMGAYDGREHFIYGEPRELITKVCIQEYYLEYRWVHNSAPASYEFLWDLRARAETSKMKVLELLAKVNNTIPIAFPIWYEEALRDEEERSQAKVVVRVNEVARAYSKATLSTFSCLK